MTGNELLMNDVTLWVCSYIGAAIGSFRVAGARFECGDTICDGKIANGPTSMLARR